MPVNKELIRKATKIIVENQKGSASLLQRKLKLGYRDAISIINHLEKEGIVGPFKETAHRQVLVQNLAALDKLNELKARKLAKAKQEIIQELDNRGKGEIELAQINDFNLFLKKFQNEIIQVDKKYIHQFVKVSNYLKAKNKNIQRIFKSIKVASNDEEFEEYVKILRGEIHCYNLVLFNSLNMIVSLVGNNWITFYEIYETFDKLNIFRSNWENELSQQLSRMDDNLTSIRDNLNRLKDNIQKLAYEIMDEIGELTYVTEESNRMLNSQLEEIGSSVRANNLLSAINTFVIYRTK